MKQKAKKAEAVAKEAAGATGERNGGDAGYSKRGNRGVRGHLSGRHCGNT